MFNRASHPVWLTGAILAMLLFPAAARAADITHPGDPLSPTSPFTSAPSFYPGSSLSGNTVTVNGGVIPGEVDGGVVDGPEAVFGNTVIINGSPTINVVYGGRSSGGDVSGNRVTVNGDSAVIQGDSGVPANPGRLDDPFTGDFPVGAPLIGSGVIGGRTVTGDALRNTVTIHGGAITNSVRGGWSENGRAAFNTVIMDGGEIVSAANGDIFGGVGGAGGAADNTVLITGGTVGHGVYGGWAAAGGQAARNLVRLATAKVTVQVYGGYTQGSGDARENVVELYDGSENAGTVGGWATGTGNAVGNRVTMYGGLVGTNHSLDGGTSNGGSAFGNVVELRGGTVTQGNIQGGRVTGGTGRTYDNQALIFGGTVNGNVYGGRNASANSGAGGSADNYVRVSGGSVAADVYGGFAVNGPVSGNAAEFSDGSSVGGAVYGGRANSAAGATGNRVTISGGRFGGDIHGGFSQGGPATGNLMELSGAPNLAAATLYGGLSGDVSMDAFTGNSFTVRRTRGPVVGIHNFEDYNFFLPASLGNGQTMLTVTGGLDTDLAGTTMTVLGIEGGGEILRPGDSVVLIDRVENFPAVTHATRVPKGVALIYDFDVSTDDGTLRLSLRDVDRNPEADPLPGPRAASLTLVGHYGDLIGGLAAARILEPEERKQRPTIYAVASGSTYRYQRGLDLDVDGGSLLMGMDWGGSSSVGDHTLGVFFEAGRARYDLRHQPEHVPSLGGDGRVEYAGAGVLGILELPGDFYLEASARGGAVSNHYEFEELADLGRLKIDYDLNHAYYGGHAGLGYLRPVGEKGALDVSTKYLWVRQEGDEARVLGDRLHFRPNDSQRWRTMARYTHEVADHLRPYVGAGFEYEFDGRVEVEAHGFTLASPDIRGGVGLLEAGLTYDPGPLFVDFGVRGSTGLRDGVAGWVQVGYTF